MAQAIGDVLMDRAKWMIYHVMLQRPENRFKGFDPNRHQLRWKYIANRSDCIRYDVIHPGDNSMPYFVHEWQYIEFWDIKFKDVKDVEVFDPVEIGKEPEDAWKMEIDARHLSTPIKRKYSATFSEFESHEKSFEKSLMQGVYASFRVGGDEDVVQTSISTAFEAGQCWGNVDLKSTSVDKTIDSDVECPAGKRQRYWATRDVCEMEQRIIGKSDFEHSIYISSIGNWPTVFGPNRDWEFRWNSFRHFMDCQRGLAPGALSEDWRRNPSPADQLDYLDRALGAEIDHTYQYKSATTSRIVGEDY